MISPSALILYVVSDVIFLAGEDIDVFDDPTSYPNYFALDEAVTRISDIGVLCECLASLAMLICLVELGISFLFCSSGAHVSHNMLRWAAIGLSVVLVALAIACFGEMTSFRTDYYNAIDNATAYGNYTYNNIYNTINNIDYSKWKTSNKLGISFGIIEWGAAIVIVVLGFFVMHKFRDRTPLRRVSAKSS